MAGDQSGTVTGKVNAREVYSQLRGVAVFSELRESDASCLGDVEVRQLAKGTLLYRSGDEIRSFWGVLSGEIRIAKQEADGSTTHLMRVQAGDSFGEVALVFGKIAVGASCEVVADTTLIGIAEDAFWKVMATCPAVRGAILLNMETRWQYYQAFAAHREKLISLGTLAAGLMHELNNPGTAARRAAAQLRENLARLQQISLRFCEHPMRQDQISCMKELQERTLVGARPKAMSSIEQSDAEEGLAEWLEEAGVSHSWKIAPTLTGIGFAQTDLECTRHAFAGETFSDALHWLVSLVSSMQLVTTIEESITRVSELVVAVKKYSRNESMGTCSAVDIHDGLLSTITILSHKLRPKDLKIDKQFAPDLPAIASRGAGLSQVWTNLLDNAIDASPAGGKIRIRTWVEDKNACVGIADEGPGISEENRKHLFEPFFTTKPLGLGTGLGLGIAHRIVVESYGGKIDFDTRPGSTEFIVRLPAFQ
jgi:signal transduction histidine kinase